MMTKRIQVALDGVLVLLLVSSLLIAGNCAKSRHVATVTDVSLVQIIVAIDQAEQAAWLQKLITPDQHTRLNAAILKAAKDAQAATAAIRATPKDAPLPTSIPNILTDIQDIQTVVAQLAPAVQSGFLGHITDALNKAADLIKAFAGGA